MQRMPITITTKALKKGKPDIETFNSQLLQMDGQIIFILDEITKRTLDRKRFTLEPGCKVTYEDMSFICTDVSTTHYPKHPVIKVMPVA